MKTKFLLVCSLMLGSFFAQAQSKVFKEVSDEISSQIKTIRQDDALVGYLVFTQLEKVTEDSFNYKLTIMDENLNDIGTVNFREQNLDLQSVSFEQDILCIAYLKSNVINRQFRNKKAYNAALANANNSIVTQFLNLDGKIIKVNSIKAEINTVKETVAYTGDKFLGKGSLKQGIQLKNIAQKGFACFYGDDDNNFLIVYDAAGNQLWKKNIGKLAKSFYLMSSDADIYLLSKKEDKNLEGGYEVSAYDYAGNVNYEKYVLKDKSGNSLKIIGVGNDPTTNKPYMTGTILNPSMKAIYTVKDATKGPYIGVFTININGSKKSDIKETYSYWNKKAYSSITERGKFAESEAYSMLSHSFKDYKGDTYFVGSSIIKRTKWGTIASSVILAPLFVVSPLLLMTGTVKCKITDAMLLKQNPDGKISYESTIPCNSSSFIPGRAPMVTFGPQKSFYSVNNTNTKNDFVIVDDIKDIVIYNVTQKKVAKTISHKDGSIRTNIYPAKEGHVMVSEYNKKEKYTRFSIESL